MSAGDPIVLTDAAEIREALERADLVPHPSADPRPGATNRLRASMARFSGPADHPQRRQAVVDAIRAIDPERALGFATEQAASRLTGEPIDGTQIAGTVPTEALARCLALEAPLEQVVADMLAIVRVIGRGAAIDAAIRRGDRADADVVCGPSRRRRADGVGPLPELRCDVVVADDAAPGVRHAGTGGAGRTPDPPGRGGGCGVDPTPIPQGSDILLEIGQAGLPWGSGPHYCPGQRLAEAIVAGILAAIDAAQYEVDVTGILTDPDGRPTRLPMSPK